MLSEYTENTITSRHYIVLFIFNISLNEKRLGITVFVDYTKCDTAVAQPNIS